MSLERKSTTRLNLPLCNIPDEHREQYRFNGRNLCLYADSDECPYREDLLGKRFCKFGEKEED